MRRSETCSEVSDDGTRDPVAQGHGAVVPFVASRGRDAHADEQPRSGRGGASRGPGRLRGDRPRRAFVGGVRRDRANAADAPRRRNAAGAVGEAGRRLPDARHGAEGVDLELDAGAEMGGLGHVPRARGGRAHDVRADDGRFVDLHRNAGDLAGDVRDARGVRASAVRRHAAGHDHADGRIGWDGRRPTARRHHERRRRALHRRRPHADRAAHQDALPRSRDRRPRDGIGVDRRGTCRR